MEMREFVVHTHLDPQAVDAWVEAGWLIPHQEGAERDFSDIDMARALLIYDLKYGIGVNDEGVPVILDLLDQLHGLRRILRELLERSRP